MKVEERATEVVVDLRSFRLPGWVWMGIAGLILYLARTYITDSGLVELIGLGVYMLLKYVEVKANAGDLDVIADWFRRAHAEVNLWRSRSIPETAGPTMRSGSIDTGVKPIEVKQPGDWSRWMFD